DFLVAQHFVVAGFFHVEDFALQREDGLVLPVASAFGGAAGRLALDEEQFTAFGVLFLAIRQFSWQSAGIERTFAAGEIAGLAGGFSGARGVNRLGNNPFGDCGVLV